MQRHAHFLHSKARVFIVGLLTAFDFAFDINRINEGAAM